ncbi:MAG TPA: GNAT family N-acetyltransferase [Bacilli bacterium]|nr:GNAT family N-acetyltransferase [Bacilli bacterium]
MSGGTETSGVSAVRVEAIDDSKRAAVRAFLIEHWGSPQMVYSQGVHHCDELPGFVAYDGDELIGLVTYAVQETSYEVVSLDSLREGHGIGTRLMEAVEKAAREAGVSCVRLITTNDNLNALRFYQKRGYVLVKIYPNAVAKARRIKPQIPLIGSDGIPIRDEIELEKGIGEEE